MFAVRLALAPLSGESRETTLSTAISLPIAVLRPRPRFMSVLLICSGVQLGLAGMMSATAPDMTPAAIEVPPTLK